MADKKIDLVKGAVANFMDSAKSLNVEAKDWNVKVGGTPEGTQLMLQLNSLFLNKRSNLRFVTFFN